MGAPVGVADRLRPLVATLAAVAGCAATLTRSATAEADSVHLEPALSTAFVVPVSTSSVGAEGAVRLGIELHPSWAIDVVGGVGVSFGTHPRGWIRLAAGPRWQSRLDGWWPHVGLRVWHIHDASRQSWMEHFGANLVGDPSHGLMHTSCMALAAGSSWPLTPRWAVFVELEGALVVHAGGRDPGAPHGWVLAGAGVRWLQRR
ncbi:MAG: hypothetical protein RMK74_02595 [Myxococcales bacterium]|nr:hypothetical protein [Myxococcales bacterium]